MNNLHIRWESAFLCLSVFLTAIFLYLYPASLGILTILWSVFSFYKVIVLMSVSDKKEQSSERTPSNIIKGLEQEKSKKKQLYLRAGIKTQLLILFACTLLSCSLAVFFFKGQVIYGFGLITLSAMIFWHMHNNSLNPDRASILGTIFSFGFSLQILLFHNLSVSKEAVLGLNALEIIISPVALYLGYIFLRGLITRHKYHLFPMIGLFLLFFVYLTSLQFSPMVIPVLAALFGVCFAQSFSTSRPHYNLYMSYKVKYT